jgi:hypothetical protein
MATFAALALLCWAELAVAAGATAADATKEQWAAAQTTFKVGDDLYDAGRYTEAVTAYRASYEIVASPNSRLMIARALREQGKLIDAHLEFRATLDEARASAAADGKYEGTVSAATTEKAALEAQLARVLLKFAGEPELAKLSVGGRQLAPADAAEPIFVMPGEISVIAHTRDGRQAQSQVELTAGAQQTLLLQFPAPASRQRPPPAAPPKLDSASDPLRTLSYVAGGVGAVGLIAFGVFGVLNNGTHADLEQRCAGDRCDPAEQDDIDAGRRYQLLANIGLAVGVLGLGTGATLFVVSAPTERQSAWSVDVSPASLRLKGRF